MTIPSSLRLLRRPHLIIFACVLVLLVACVNFYGTDSWTSVTSLLRKYRNYPRPIGDGSRYYSFRTPSFFPPLKKKHGKTPNDLCKDFPTHLLDKIQIVLKTGAGESAKTKAHLENVSSCITNLLVFSDVEEVIAGHQIIDILADLPPTYNENADFAAYAAQKKAQAEGKSVEYSGEGWKLDRFKFFPMVDKAYEMRPQADWYVFIEADVYYFWDTLFRLLHQLDPSYPHYLGSASPGRDNIWFAYGGAGFVLSRGVMEPLTSSTDPAKQLAVRYQDLAINDCCGDAALAYAIMDQTGVRLQGLYPTFAGDDIDGLSVNRDRWCVPLLALHRVSPEQMTALWRWERTRAYDQLPFTYATMTDYTMTVIDQAPARASWDNFANIVQPEGSVAHSSMSACMWACTSNPDCMQFSRSADGICKFGNSVQLGHSVSESNHTSGWNMERVSELGYQAGAGKSSSCEEARWLNFS